MLVEQEARGRLQLVSERYNRIMAEATQLLGSKLPGAGRAASRVLSICGLLEQSDDIPRIKGHLRRLNQPGQKVVEDSDGEMIVMPVPASDQDIAETIYIVDFLLQRVEFSLGVAEKEMSLACQPGLVAVR